MTKKTCPDKSCGYEQDIIKDSRRKQNKTYRCTGCNKVNKLRAITLAILMTFVIGIGSVYAEEQTVQIPWNSTGFSCGSLAENLFACYFYRGGIEVVLPVSITTPSGEVIEYEFVEEEPIVEEIIPTKKPKFDLKIYLEDPLSMSSYSSREVLDAAIKDENLLGAICFNPAGAEIENTIDFGKLGGKINVKRPFDNQPLQQRPELKAEHLLSEMCKSIRTLEYIVENPLRTYPGEGWAYSFDLNYDVINKFMENITKTEEYSKRAITERTFIVTQEDAQEFMCNADGKARGLCVQEFTGTNKGGYIDTTNNPILAKLDQYKASPENAIGEPRYDVKTDSKCYTLASFAKQHSLDEESRRDLLIAGGCAV